MAAPPPGALRVGDQYFSIECKSCQSVVPVHANPDGAQEMYWPRGGNPMRVGCPFCGATGEYNEAEVTTRELKVMPPTTN